MDTRRKKIADAMAAVESGVPTHIEQLRKMLELEERRKMMEALGVAPQSIISEDMRSSPTQPIGSFEGEARGKMPIGPQVGKPAKPVPLPNVRPLNKKIVERARLYELMK
jgi:hypothetical protein